MFMRHGRLYLFVLPVVLGPLSIGIGCKPEAATTTELPVPKVTVAEVIAHETLDADEYTGRTEASELVEVRARVYGYLKSIDFQDGELVEEGQLLFKIEPDEYEAIYRQSLAQISLFNAKHELAKANLARRAKLVQSGTVSKEEYEESVAAVKEIEAAIVAAKADANRTALDLKYTDVKAPISGRIDRAFVTKGNLLTGGQSSGTLLTKIVQEQPMYVYFDVDERSLLGYMRQRAATRDSAPGSLRELGMEVYLKLSDETEFSHVGQLDFAATEVNTSTGTARIRGVFPNQNRELVSGLFVRVQVPVSKPYEALMIPEQAIATDQSVKFVYVVGSDGVANRRAVTLGGQRGELRIISEGLQAGERVITKGLQRVRPGQKVEAELAQVAPPPSVAPQPPTDTQSPEASDEPPAGTREDAGDSGDESSDEEQPRG
jgi:RND family efflux transporter MFP subunit